MNNALGPYGLSISILLISIMLSISGIVLGLGYALDDKKLKEFGKNELYQSLINGVLVGSFMLLFMNNGIVSSVINSLTASSGVSFSCSSYMSGNSAICFAYNYLAGLSPFTFSGHTYSSLLTVMGELLAALMALVVVLGLIAGIRVTAPIVSFSLSTALNPIIVAIQHIITLLSASMLSVLVQVALLAFVSVAAVSIILPIGIVLRTFYPTRRLGGFLIATAIGLYVVFPLSYLLNASMLNSYSVSINENNITAITTEASSLENNMLTMGNSSITHVATVQTFLSGINSLISQFLAFLSSIIVQVFILPTFSLILTALSIREFSRVLGSEAFFGKLNVL